MVDDNAKCFECGEANPKWASLNNGILKNRLEVTKLNTIITPKFNNDLLSVSMSFMPMDKPIPNIGPINGEISMAPITTAVELTFKPIEAIIIEKTRI